MKQIIRWGVLGCGGIANKFVNSIGGIEGVELTAVASQTPGKSELFAKKYNIKTFYSKYSDLLQNKDIDVIYIATTHNFHYENVKLVLEAGKAILCEKPFTVNAREMKNLIDIAKTKRVFMMEAVWTRFLPVMEQIRIWLKEGKIGKIKQVRAGFGIMLERHPEHRLLNYQLAGGAALDAGVYPISFANMVMRDKPIEVKAVGEIGMTDVDVQSFYILKYESGCLAQLDASLNATHSSRAEIIGTEGKIVIPENFLRAERVSLHLNDQDPIELDFPFDADKGFMFEIEAVAQSLRDGLVENEIMPLSDTLQSMEILDEIKKQLGLVYENDKV